MTRYFLQYWTLPSALFNVDQGEMLNHTAGNQLGKLRAGDILWMATIQDGALYILGSFRVGQITNQKTAERLLGPGLWIADWHALALSNPTSPIGFRRLPMRLAKRLCFESDRSPSLTIRNGKIEAQQLQAIRQLTEQSAALLQWDWEEYEV